MKIVLKDNISLYLEDITHDEVNIIFEAFTFENENAYAQQNSSAYRPWQNKILKFNRVKRTMSRTFLGRLVHFCTTRGLPFHIEDKRPKWEYSHIDPKLVDENFLPGIKLEEYQIDAIKTGIKCECGLFSLITGAGKSELIAGLCKAIDCPTLILADMTIVVSQLKERLQLREVSSEIGMFFAGKKPNGENIIIGSIQSLTMPKPPRERPERSEYDDDKKHVAAIKRWESSILGYQTRKRNHKMLMEYVKNAEMLIVDECDRSSGPSYREVIRKQFRGRRKYGFSGTVFDESKPIANLNIEENFGYIICEKGRQEVEEKGRIVPIKYRMIYYSDPEYHFRNKINVEDAIRLFMVENPKLHAMIYGILRCHKGEKNMILVDRIELGDTINDYLSNASLSSKFICGTTPKKERDNILSDFAAGKLDVMIGGKVVNRGLDIKGGVDNLIMATTGKLRSEFLQKIGRAVRVNERGYSHVYGFLMRCNHYLFEHSKAALNTIISAGYESQVNFGHTVVTGEEAIRRKFVPPPLNSKKNNSPKQKELF